jgi:hypothetical protein
VGVGGGVGGGGGGGGGGGRGGGGGGGGPWMRQRLKLTTPRFTLGDAQSILIAGQQQRVFHPCRTAASVLAMLHRLWFQRNQVTDFARTGA